MYAPRGFVECLLGVKLAFWVVFKVCTSGLCTAVGDLYLLVFYSSNENVMYNHVYYSQNTIKTVPRVFI
jgi:hypothetical protein